MKLGKINCIFSFSFFFLFLNLNILYAGNSQSAIREPIDKIEQIDNDAVAEQMVNESRISYHASKDENEASVLAFMPGGDCYYHIARNHTVDASNNKEPSPPSETIDEKPQLSFTSVSSNHLPSTHTIQSQNSSDRSQISQDKKIKGKLKAENTLQCPRTTNEESTYSENPTYSLNSTRTLSSDFENIKSTDLTELKHERVESALSGFEEFLNLGGSSLGSYDDSSSSFLELSSDNELAEQRKKLIEKEKRKSRYVQEEIDYPSDESRSEVSDACLTSNGMNHSDFDDEMFHEYSAKLNQNSPDINNEQFHRETDSHSSSEDTKKCTLISNMNEENLVDKADNIELEKDNSQDIVSGTLHELAEFTYNDNKKRIGQLTHIDGEEGSSNHSSVEGLFSAVNQVKESTGHLENSNQNEIMNSNINSPQINPTDVTSDVISVINDEAKKYEIDVIRDEAKVSEAITSIYKTTPDNLDFVVAPLYNCASFLDTCGGTCEINKTTAVTPQNDVTELDKLITQAVQFFNDKNIWKIKASERYEMINKGELASILIKGLEISKNITFELVPNSTETTSYIPQKEFINYFFKAVSLQKISSDHSKKQKYHFERRNTEKINPTIKHTIIEEWDSSKLRFTVEHSNLSKGLFLIFFHKFLTNSTAVETKRNE